MQTFIRRVEAWGLLRVSPHRSPIVALAVQDLFCRSGGMKLEPSRFDEIDVEADAEALADIAAGRVVPHAEVEAWLKTWETPDEKPAPAHGFK